MFTAKDLKQFAELGISPENIETQISYFKNKFPFSNIISPATIEKGIIKISESQAVELAKDYDKKIKDFKAVKFVPASGAASRMFQNLFKYTNNKKLDVKKDKSFNSAYNFIENIEKFAFYKNLYEETKKNNIDIKKDFIETIKILLTEKGLNYGNLPKGLLKFHKYDSFTRTPAEEHIAEAKKHTLLNNEINIHFTVSPEHKNAFENLFKKISVQYKEKHNINLNTDISEQKKSTNTIAVDKNNNPFREKDGSILFRPGGHGALIENLNEINADIIFVKNIDNIVPEKNSEDTILYKKVLGAVTINTFNEIKKHIENLKNKFSEDTLIEAENFMESKFYLTIDRINKNTEERLKFIYEKLNRPLRVCGMVKNEGEPGGGPFFIKDNKNNISLQIVESSQIDLSDKEKNTILKNSTHFNPVDLALYIKDYKGDKFDLRDFVDKNTGFISKKSKDGKELKAMELPGLWNGAMAFWNTIFVEVPISTFNPVKTVNDLLRKMHQ